jgi:hypothetical protein
VCVCVCVCSTRRVETDASRARHDETAAPCHGRRGSASGRPECVQHPARSNRSGPITPSRRSRIATAPSSHGRRRPDGPSVCRPRRVAIAASPPSAARSTRLRLPPRAAGGPRRAAQVWAAPGVSCSQRAEHRDSSVTGRSHDVKAVPRNAERLGLSEASTPLAARTMLQLSPASVVREQALGGTSTCLCYVTCSHCNGHSPSCP